MVEQIVGGVVVKVKVQADMSVVEVDAMRVKMYDEQELGYKHYFAHHVRCSHYSTATEALLEQENT